MGPHRICPGTHHQISGLQGRSKSRSILNITATKGEEFRRPGQPQLTKRWGIPSYRVIPLKFGMLRKLKEKQFGLGSNQFPSFHRIHTFWSIHKCAVRLFGRIVFSKKIHIQVHHLHQDKPLWYICNVILIILNGSAICMCTAWSNLIQSYASDLPCKGTAAYRVGLIELRPEKIHATYGLWGFCMIVRMQTGKERVPSGRLTWLWKVTILDKLISYNFAMMSKANF